MNLLNKLLTADVVCKDCGTEYGKYSVGCSSTWQGTCGVCGEDKPVTEVRDWGYLTKGIKAEKVKIGWQSLEVANYMKCQEELTAKREDLIAQMASVGPIMNDEELEDCLRASYEQGEIASRETDNHPITPSQELVDKWVAMLEYCEDIDVFTDVARWGADQQLIAAAKWLDHNALNEPHLRIIPVGESLKEAMRPKPPSLKEQALAELELLRGDANAHGLGFDAPAIRRALEALPE